MVAANIPTFAWKGETEEEFLWCIEQTILTDTQKVYLHHKISLKLGSSIEEIDKVKLSDNNKQDLIKILNFFFNSFFTDHINTQNISIKKIQYFNQVLFVVIT
jgi:hypothetical protein